MIGVGDLCRQRSPPFVRGVPRPTTSFSWICNRDGSYARDGDRSFLGGKPRVRDGSRDRSVHPPAELPDYDVELFNDVV